MMIVRSIHRFALLSSTTAKDIIISSIIITTIFSSIIITTIIITIIIITITIFITFIVIIVTPYYHYCTLLSMIIITIGGRPNAQYPSVPLCASSDVLVRRFFLFDVVSGITSINSNGGTPATPSYIRYASFIKIEVSTVINAASLIYPPVLTITYTEAASSSISSKSMDEVQLHGIYTMNTAAFQQTFQALFITIMVGS